MNKKIIWVIPLILIFVSLIIFLRPVRMTFDKSVSENRLLFKYEVFGCGSLVGKVLDGGEEITSAFVEKYPDIGINEVVFSKGSDEPRKTIDSDEFFFDGMAEKYTYVIEGQPVGVAKGAPDCCDPNGFAYNEKVVEFKVDKWYLTSYVPYIMMGNMYVLGCAFYSMLISFLWLFLLLLWHLCKTVIRIIRF